jgi:Leucine-rich repeat (LRR) protein
VQELIENNFKFPEEDNSGKAAIENSMPPEIPNRTKVDELTPEVIQLAARESQLDFIKYLNLFNNNIKQIECLTSLTNLTTLILSFNEIKVIEGLEACVNLKKLDLNHNFISKIDSIQTLTELNTLNLANNWIFDMNDINCITDNSIPVSELSLKCNPIAAHESYRTQMFVIIPYLKKLDGMSLNDRDKEEESETVMTKEFVESAINSTTSPPEAGMKRVIGVSHDGTKEDTFGSQGDDLERSSSVTQQNSSTGPEILIINHQKVKVIQNLLELNNLRRLSLIDNMIGKIEGLESCKLLEELSLEKNRIQKIEGLSHLQYLKKLDLGSNKIREIENLEGLDNLTQLSLEDNEIYMMVGLDSLLNLMEFYIGNNVLTNIKQIILLKKLPKLIILDISGNEMSRERFYIIYHLKKKLKVLDGISIEQTEIQQSNEMFSGRLTDEILESR